MEISKDYDFKDLIDEVWGPAKRFLEKVQNYGLENELFEELENNYISTPTMSEVNDFLGYSLDNDWIAQNIDITSMDIDAIIDAIRDLSDDINICEALDRIHEANKEEEFYKYIMDNFWTLSEVIDCLFDDSFEIE